MHFSLEAQLLWVKFNSADTKVILQNDNSQKNNITKGKKDIKHDWKIAHSNNPLIILGKEELPSQTVLKAP